MGLFCGLCPSQETPCELVDYAERLLHSLRSGQTQYLQRPLGNPAPLKHYGEEHDDFIASLHSTDSFLWVFNGPLRNKVQLVKKNLVACSYPRWIVSQGPRVKFQKKIDPEPWPCGPSQNPHFQRNIHHLQRSIYITLYGKKD